MADVSPDYNIIKKVKLSVVKDEHNLLELPQFLNKIFAVLIIILNRRRKRDVTVTCLLLGSLV